MAQVGFGSPRWSEPWSAFDQLRREMDSLLGSWMTRSWPEGPAGEVPGVFPAVNLFETADSLVLTAELPGVRPDEIEVSVEGQRVSLRGQRGVELPEGASAHRRERQGGAFHRTLQLPHEVDGDKAEAVVRHGVLSLRLPKPEARQPRRIQVNAA